MAPIPQEAQDKAQDILCRVIGARTGLGKPAADRLAAAAVKAAARKLAPRYKGESK